MSDDQFTKLLKYMSREFGAVRKEIVYLRKEINLNANKLLGSTMRIDSYMQEFISLRQK